MRNAFVIFTVIISVLFTALESIAEEIVDDHHAASSHAESLLDGAPSADVDDDQNHCGHCYHSHAGHPVFIPDGSGYQKFGNHIAYREPHLAAFLQAPPTPPPNA